jgi:hypothetical protein
MRLPPAFLCCLAQTQTAAPYRRAPREAPALALATAAAPEGQTRHGARAACR